MDDGNTEIILSTHDGSKNIKKIVIDVNRFSQKLCSIVEGNGLRYDIKYKVDQIKTGTIKAPPVTSTATTQKVKTAWTQVSEVQTQNHTFTSYTFV